MSRIRGFDTGIEMLVRRALTQAGVRYRKHIMKLPGRPDLVFKKPHVVVFIDGDFWHGYRYPAWRTRLTPSWQSKIEGNRRRDRNNFAKLRRAGWHVVRIWEHEVHHDLDACVQRIRKAVDGRSLRRR